jgi:hypothetical protein
MWFVEQKKTLDLGTSSIYIEIQLCARLVLEGLISIIPTSSLKLWNPCFKKIVLESGFVEQKRTLLIYGCVQDIPKLG